MAFRYDDNPDERELFLHALTQISDDDPLVREIARTAEKPDGITEQDLRKLYCAAVRLAWTVL